MTEGSIELWRADVERQWKDWCKELDELLASCKADGGAILARAAIRADRDSYPTSVPGASPASSGGTFARTGEEDEDEGPPSYGDVVGERAMAGGIEVHDPVAEAADALCAHMAAALTALKAADKARRKACFVPVAEQAGRKAPACVNCAVWEIYTPATPKKAGRCDDCFEYRAKHGNRDAPGLVVMARPGNATPKQLERGAGTERPKQRRRPQIPLESPFERPKL